MRSTALWLALIGASALAGCGEDDHEHEDPDVEGCEHLTEGPFQAVTATAATTGAPAVADDHKAYTVTLPAGAGGNAGYVAFAVPAVNQYLFFTDQAVTATFTTSAGTPLTAQSSTSSAACTAIKGRHVVALDVGTVNLQLSSPTATTVNLVVEPALVDHEH